MFGADDVIPHEAEDAIGPNDGVKAVIRAVFKSQGD
jgi:hypothetical protein